MAGTKYGTFGITRLELIAVIPELVSMTHSGNSTRECSPVPPALRNWEILIREIDGGHQAQAQGTDPGFAIP